jgi:hypothetical protein
LVTEGEYTHEGEIHMRFGEQEADNADF